MTAINLARIVSKIGSWTIFSRMAGYVRDMLMAQVMGASAIAEAFQIAFTFPNLFRNLFGEGAMNAALVPRFAQMASERGEVKARQFLGDVVLIVGGLMLVISSLAWIFMPEIVNLLAWGFEDEQKIALTIALARTCLPYLFCIILAAIFGGILNYAGRFSIPAAAPIILNLLMISPLAASVFGWSDFSIFMLAYAVVIGGVLQLGLCLLVAWRIDHLPIFRHRLMGGELWQFLLVLLPGILSALCLQFNLVVSRAFASTLQEGSIVWLFFAERLFQLPLALIGISFGVALLPMLSRALSEKDRVRAGHLRQQTQQGALLLSIPAAVGLAICAELIVDVLFARGAFGATDTQKTAVALQALALGLPAYIFVKVLQPLFFARHDTRTPMQIAVVMMVINIALAALLMQFWAHVGLALATALAGWVQVALLLLQLRKRALAGLAEGIPVFALKVLLAATGMAIFLWLGLHAEAELQTAIPTWLLLGGLVSIAGIGYLVAAMLLTGYRWHDVKALLRK